MNARLTLGNLRWLGVPNWIDSLDLKTIIFFEKQFNSIMELIYVMLCYVIVILRSGRSTSVLSHHICLKINRFISNILKVNRLHDPFNGTCTINLSKGDNLGENDGFLMFWVCSITLPKVNPRWGRGKVVRRSQNLRDVIYQWSLVPTSLEVYEMKASPTFQTKADKQMKNEIHLRLFNAFSIKAIFR